MKEKQADTLRKKDLKKAAHHLWLQFQLVKKTYGLEYDAALDRYLSKKQ